MTEFLLAMAWWAIGAAAYVFWWVKEMDLTVADLVLVLAGGLLGPLNWPIGFLIHRGDAVLIKRRGGRDAN